MNDKELNQELLKKYREALPIKSESMNELKLRLEMTIREIEFIEKEIGKLEEKSCKK